MEQIWSFLQGGGELLIWLVSVGGAITAICQFVLKPVRKQLELDTIQSKKIDALAEMLRELDAKLNALSKRVGENRAEYVHDRLQSLHEYHCNELGWASAAEKQRIIEWYKEYHEMGLNHIADTYVDDIARLPEHPDK